MKRKYHFKEMNDVASKGKTEDLSIRKSTVGKLNRHGAPGMDVPQELTLFDVWKIKRRGVCGHEGAGGKGESDDWITPRWIIDALGPFDLDPCESDFQPWPCASMAYHKPEGLLLPWSGRVWCNPPYGQQLGDWLERCAKHGNAVALTFARTETRHFFRGVWGKADGLLFLRGRVRFHRPDGNPGNAGTGPSVLIAYGEQNAKRLQALDPRRGRYVRG